MWSRHQIPPGELHLILLKDSSSSQQLVLLFRAVSSRRLQQGQSTVQPCRWAAPIPELFVGCSNFLDSSRRDGSGMHCSSMQLLPGVTICSSQAALKITDVIFGCSGEGWFIWEEHFIFSLTHSQHCCDWTSVPERMLPKPRVMRVEWPHWKLLLLLASTSFHIVL